MNCPYHWLLTALCCLPAVLNGQTYRTRILQPDYKTLQVNLTENWLAPPVIELENDRQIEISFDQLSHDVHYLSYSIVHCNADWTPSGLSELEYIDGFNTNPVEYAEPSFNTYIPYTHYKIALPNESVRFLVSGNYAVRVYPENQPDRPVLYACFSVVDNRVGIAATVTSRTDVGYNRGHQQVNFTVSHPQYPIRDPYSELKIIVTQNNRRDNEAVVKAPTYVGRNELVYEHNRDLIFEAGNEYRRFEMVSVRYAGLGVERIRFYDPFYHVTLFPATLRAGGNYTYDQTQFGRFYIRRSDAEDNELEADYFIVHFTLDYENPFIEGSIYINGELTHDIFDESSKMVYNFDTRRYEKEMMLKQGLYNYLYLFVPTGKTEGSPGLIEGNYYETMNEYMIKVYHRPQSERYDRLIGTLRCLSGK